MHIHGSNEEVLEYQSDTTICRYDFFILSVIRNMLTWMLNVCALTFVLRNPD